MAKIVTVGEGMLELAGGPPDWRLATAGDVLNTSVHLARAGHEVSFLTALGGDPFSRQMLAQWAEFGLDTSLVQTDDTRSPGLYAVSVDATGERSFTYWRDNSAARSMFSLPSSPSVIEQAKRCDLLYFSLITLAILPPEGRELLLNLAGEICTRGDVVAFDSNYRPSLWPNLEEARDLCDRAIATTSIGLPTLDDECALGSGDSAEAVAERWTRLGCDNVVIKLGALGCRLPSGEVVAPPAVLKPVDTSGAGDAFNAGFLDALLKGVSFGEAATVGHELAGWTVLHRGAIPPRRS